MTSSATKIFGIVNVTPDSFSDGGSFPDSASAVGYALRLVADGADLIDVGGESTRPGAERVPAAVERERVLPVVAALADRSIPVSIDTMNASTARAALDVGAVVINDVSGGRADDAMAGVVAESGVPYVTMHWRSPSSEMHRHAEYADAPRDVRNELKQRIAELVVAGVQPEQIILDPGLGFAKEGSHNWQLLARLGELQTLGYPLLIGASRKRFLQQLSHQATDTPESRDLPTAVISALVSAAGAWAVRVHDVRSTRVALDVIEAWKGGLRR